MFSMFGRTGAPQKGAPELKEDPQIFLRRDADNTVTVRDV